MCTFSFRLSMALSIQPTVPSPPAAKTRNVTCGNRWHHSKPHSGGMSHKSITCKWIQKGFLLQSNTIASHSYDQEALRTSLRESKVSFQVSDQTSFNSGNKLCSKKIRGCQTSALQNTVAYSLLGLSRCCKGIRHTKSSLWNQSLLKISAPRVLGQTAEDQVLRNVASIIYTIDNPILSTGIPF